MFLASRLLRLDRRGGTEAATASLCANTGSRNFPKAFVPPKLAGTPSQPAQTEQMANTTSGPVIDLGDS